MPAKSVRMLAASLLLSLATVALAVWAVNAFRYAARVRHWPIALGTVVAQPADRAAIRFADAAGSSHLMPLAKGDTDDLPAGSVIYVSYDLSADGQVRSEFRVQPGARASALTVLALVAATGVGVTAWRGLVERRAELPAAH